MDINQAIVKFNSFRAQSFSDQDVEKINFIVADLVLTEFTVVASGAYIRDKNSTIHVNPGFVVSKRPGTGLIPDPAYEDIGFGYRCWLSGQAKKKRGETSIEKSHCPLCTGLPGDDHLLEECPRHP